jgi:hypothetical protein
MTARKPKATVLVVEQDPKDKAREELHMAYEAYMRSMGVEPGSAATKPKVMLASFLGSIATMVLGYTLGIKLAEILCTAVYALTGWVYFSLAIYIVGFVLSAMVSLYAAGRVAKYLSNGTYSDDMVVLKNRMVQWFSNKSTAAKRAVLSGQAA